MQRAQQRRASGRKLVLTCGILCACVGAYTACEGDFFENDDFVYLNPLLEQPQTDGDKTEAASAAKTRQEESSTWPAAVELLDEPSCDPAAKLEPVSADVKHARTRNKTRAPYFYVNSDGVDEMPLKSSHAQVDITGVIARVKVSQAYVNHGQRVLEANYVFPASTRAAVYALTMHVGDRIIEAEIKTKDDARQEYKQAKQQGQTASLLEQHCANVLQMHVANILPGDEIVVDLWYTELLVPSEGVYEFVYPTVVGPKYSKSPQGEVKTAYLAEGKAAPYSVGLDINVRGSMPIASIRSNQNLHVEYRTPALARVIVDDESAVGSKDFILRFSLANKQIQTGMLLYEGDDENFFLLMLEPPPRPRSAQVLAREYIFVVDVSGSMDGFPIETSKQLMRELLTTLGPDDSFNVLLFAGASQLFSPESKPASDVNVQAAMAFVDAHNAGGGTQLIDALRTAYAVPKNSSLSRSVVLLTDGYVDVENAAFRLVRTQLRHSNLFAFGVGESVNRLLIEGLAEAGMGEPFVVDNAGRAEAQVKRFKRYVSSPILKDIHVEFDGFDAYDVEPQKLPELFAQRPVVLFGKYRGKAAGDVVIKGINHAGRIELRSSTEFAYASDNNSALRQLWARQRLHRLSDMRFSKGASTKNLIALSLNYNVLCQHTAFVAVDKSVRTTQTASTVTQAQPLPADVSAMALGPNTAATVTPLSFGACGHSAGESIGYGGLGLRGIGAGGGGSGYGIGRGAVGGMASGHGHGATRVSRGQAIVMGGMDKSIVRRVIQQRRAQLRYCYERELIKDPSLAGRLEIAFTIETNGRVSGFSVNNDQLGNDAVIQCIKKAFMQLRFPSGNGIVIVNYPLVFRRLAEDQE